MPKSRNKGSLPFDERQISQINQMIQKSFTKISKLIINSNKNRNNNTNPSVLSEINSNEFNPLSNNDGNNKQSQNNANCNINETVEINKNSKKRKFLPDISHKVKNLIAEWSDYESEMDGDMDHDFDFNPNLDNDYLPIPSDVGGRFKGIPVDVSGGANTSNVNVDKTSDRIKIRAPPIIIKDINSAQFILIKNLVNKIKGALIKTHLKGITVFVNETEQHKQLITELKQSDVHFYTYTAKGQRPKVMVAKGIHPETTVDEIKNEILKKDLKVLNVYSMSKKTRTDNGDIIETKLPCFTITFEASTKRNDIQNIVGCCGYKITWEVKHKQAVTQCRRCQAFGHVASACNMKYSCVKCAESHNYGECPVNKTSAEKDPVLIKCTNCQEAHVASFPGCKEREAYIGKLNNFKFNNVNGRSLNYNFQLNKFNSNYKKPGVTYAEQVKIMPSADSRFQRQVNFPSLENASRNFEQDKTPIRNSNSNAKYPLSDFIDLSQNLFGVSFSTLTSQITDFMAKLNLVHDLNDKRSMYLNFTCQYFK